MRNLRRWQTVVDNVLANYAYVGLMAAVTIFLTPLYVRTLGPIEWGVVALCLTVQAVLFLLDAGLGQVAPREFASVTNDRLAQWRLYLRFRGLYAKLALLAMALTMQRLGQGGDAPGLRAALDSTAFRLETTQDLARVGDWELDRHSGRMRWSRQLFRLFDRPEALGVPDINEALAYYNPAALERTRDAFWQAIDTGKVEFTYRGDATVARPAPDAGTDAFHDYLYLRDNPAGEHRELWFHEQGDRSWLVVTRNTVTHEILAVEAVADRKGGAA